MIKRKRLDRDIWKSITSKRYIQKNVNNSRFNGIVSLLYIDSVSRVSRWPYPDRDITVCDKGMRWLQLLPEDGNVLVTAMINPDDVIDIWYIDISAGHGIDADGVAFYDDLYLDIVVRPNGDIKIDDMDELEDALEKNYIDKQLFDMAIKTKDDLVGLLKIKLPEFYDFCIELLHETES